MSADPTSAIAEIVVGIVEAVAHISDPEARKAATRDLVRAEQAKWAAISPQLASQRADEITRRHHEEHAAREARSEETTQRIDVPVKP